MGIIICKLNVAYLHSVKPENIVTFLGQKLHGNYEGEMGTRFQKRILGKRIKHQMGAVSIKMYDIYSLYPLGHLLKAANRRFLPNLSPASSSYEGTWVPVLVW